LEGEVEWPHQKDAAESALEHLLGVRGILNEIARWQSPHRHAVTLRTAMFPIGEENSSRRSLAVMVFLLLLANIFVFLVELTRGESFIAAYAAIVEHTAQQQGGGVAYLAHIGGFIAGLILSFFFRRPLKAERGDRAWS
jgi:membrane associated rhomboid family serine protease